jgi:excisionase family DNA binding protein
VQEPKVYRIADVARLLGISRQHAAELIRKGEIPGGVRLGERWLVRRTVLDSWLAGPVN